MANTLPKSCVCDTKVTLFSFLGKITPHKISLIRRYKDIQLFFFITCNIVA